MEEGRGARAAIEGDGARATGALQRFGERLIARERAACEHHAPLGRRAERHAQRVVARAARVGHDDAVVQDQRKLREISPGRERRSDLVRALDDELPFRRRDQRGRVARRSLAVHRNREAPVGHEPARMLLISDAEADGEERALRVIGRELAKR